MIQDVLERVEKRLEAVGLTAQGASVRAGLSKDAIRNMQRAARSEKRRGVSTRTIQALAPVLETNAGWLLDGTGDEHEIDPMVSSAPLISWISAGALVTPDAVLEAENARRVYAPDLDPAGDWIALTVEGDSMDRISPPDSLIFVDRRDRRLVPNACYVFGDGEGGATYKRWRPDPPRIEPVTTNPSHEPTFLASGREPLVIGRVRRTVLDM
jgi:SOS-response transcriptional repressor LexA